MELCSKAMMDVGSSESSKQPKNSNKTPSVDVNYTNKEVVCFSTCLFSFDFKVPVKTSVKK